ncbi:ribosomal protein [Lithospermum erythrorhizon]|uniref:Ribosomal protein n=1 Tax=Lithospermum erythrorhizon TaxID=34254 RepID=A0AAV3NI06_LITER
MLMSLLVATILILLFYGRGKGVVLSCEYRPWSICQFRTIATRPIGRYVKSKKHLLNSFCVVLTMYHSSNTIMFVIIVKKHIKQGQGHEGGIFTVEAPLHVSNVEGKNAFKYPHVWLFTFLKLRTHIYFFSGSIIPRPEILKIRTTARPTVAGPKDTPMDVVMEKTYDSKTGLGMPDL